MTSAPEPELGAGRWVPRISDWRIWLGFGITAVCVWLAVRGIPLVEVAQAIEGTHFWSLLALSAPCYLLSVYFRALRWRYLVQPVAEVPRSMLYRSTALGFAGNNLLPLRVGELIRAWSLARGAKIPLASVVGTIALERVLDAVTVLVMALGGLGYLASAAPAGPDGPSELTRALGQGAMLLIPAAAAPVLVLVLLRLAPARSIRFVMLCARVLPSGIQVSLESAMHGFVEGLGALRGGRHLLWIALDSVMIWLVTGTAPILLGFYFFGIEMGGPLDTLVHAWILLGAVGAAVAIPSAPGFIGPYQLAFTAVLVPFGVAKPTALALGVVVWLIFWLTLTAQGLLYAAFSPGEGFELGRGRSKVLERKADRKSQGWRLICRVEPTEKSDEGEHGS
ncbi:MAG: lysylphosphatidylglycerol synthase transmembrane domain-containing protein [Myxococcota bacterium]|nr:lysylphosphatidylglycerol synthase transmembrane domain-containing protein [Myxococcota bacterium]